MALGVLHLFSLALPRSKINEHILANNSLPLPYPLTRPWLVAPYCRGGHGVLFSLKNTPDFVPRPFNVSPIRWGWSQKQNTLLPLFAQNSPLPRESPVKAITPEPKGANKNSGE